MGAIWAFFDKKNRSIAIFLTIFRPPTFHRSLVFPLNLPTHGRGERPTTHPTGPIRAHARARAASTYISAPCVRQIAAAASVGVKPLYDHYKNDEQPDSGKHALVCRG